VRKWKGLERARRLTLVVRKWKGLEKARRLTLVVRTE
jgi:hypothetical protein